MPSLKSCVLQLHKSPKKIKVQDVNSKHYTNGATISKRRKYVIGQEEHKIILLHLLLMLSVISMLIY